MYIGVSTPFQKHHPLFLVNPPPLYIGFSWTTPPPPPTKKKKKKKNWMFQWTPKILVFHFLTPSYLLIVTKFLVKNTQFEFLVIIEKNIFVYVFCHYIFQISVYFLLKLQPPSKKVTPLFPSKLPLKIEVLSSPPFWILGRRFNPPSREWGCTLWVQIHPVWVRRKGGGDRAKKNCCSNTLTLKLCNFLQWTPSSQFMPQSLS